MEGEACAQELSGLTHRKFRPAGPLPSLRQAGLDGASPGFIDHWKAVKEAHFRLRSFVKISASLTGLSESYPFGSARPEMPQIDNHHAEHRSESIESAVDN